MSSASVRARSHPQPGRFSRRYRGALSLIAYDDLFSRRPHKVRGIEPAYLDRSTVLNCNATTFHGHLPFSSMLSQPFNTHRAWGGPVG